LQLIYRFLLLNLLILLSATAQRWLAAFDNCAVATRSPLIALLLLCLLACLLADDDGDDDDMPLDKAERIDCGDCNYLAAASAPFVVVDVNCKAPANSS